MKRSIPPTLRLLSAVVAFVSIAIASPASEPVHGELDFSFDPELSVNDTVWTIVHHPDGRWIIGGFFTAVKGVPRGRIAALNTDGSLDLSFMQGLAGANSSVDALAVQEDGKIVVGGFFPVMNGVIRRRIARLHPDGTLDNTFGNGLAGADHLVTAIAIQEDGRILIGGDFTSVNGETRNRIARLHTDGSLDDTFGDGLVGPDARVECIALQPDGKILIGGHFTEVDGESRGHIARLNDDGTLDPTFVSSTSGWSGNVLAVAVEGDGRILIGGSFTSVNDVERNRIARLSPDGTTDLPFGDGLTGANGSIISLVVQDDGKILIGGVFNTVHGEPRARIARLNADGALDHDFGRGLAGALPGQLCALGLNRAENKILIGGAFTAVHGLPREGIAQLHGGESPANPPTEILLSNDTVIESRPVGTTVGVFSAIDPDAGDTHTFSFVPGDGDEGNASFTMDGHTLKTAAVFDYDIQNSHSIRIRATDSKALFFEKVVTITVEPNQAPTDISLSNLIFSEAQPIDTEIGSFTASDPDNVNHAFVLVEGEGSEGNASFAIDGDALKTAASFDADLQDTFSIRVRATDPLGLFVERTFSMNVVANRAPTNILLSPGSVGENQPPGTAVGTLTAVDPDEYDTHTFTLVTGDGDDGNSAFAIDGEELRTAQVFDREFQESYSVRLRVTDEQGLFVEKVFVLAVTEPPATALWPGEADISFAAGIGIGNVIQEIVRHGQGWIVGGWSGLVKLQADGTWDPGFSAGANDRIDAVVVQDDGKILIGGEFTAVNGEPRISIARLNPDGSLDTTFGEGQQGVEGPSPASTVRTIAVQDDGKILIGGWFDTVNGQHRSEIARLNSDGSLDESFLASANYSVHAIAIQSDDKIIIGGTFTQVNEISRNRIARLNPEGTIDPDFAPTLLGPTGASDWVKSLLVLNDGKILMGGRFTHVNGKLRNRIARLNPDGSTDRTFAEGESGSNGTILAIAVEDDGRVWIGGSFSSINDEPRGSIARLHPDGTLDQPFGEALSGTNSYITSVLPFDDQHVLIGGAFTTVNGVARQRLALLYSGDPPVNRAPTNICVSNRAIAENEVPGAPVTLFSVDDPDIDDTHTFTLASGEGDDGNAFFTIEGNLLKTAAVFEHQTHNTLTVRVRATDAGGLFVYRNFTIRVLQSPPAGTLPGNVDLSYYLRSSSTGTVKAAAQQSDGKWIVAGTFSTLVNCRTRRNIARLHADGSNDDSFLAGLSEDQTPIAAIAILDDDKILIGGSGFIRRLHADGTYDTTFSNRLWDSTALAIAVQSDGKIVIGGTFRTLSMFTHGITRNRVARLHPDGSPDLDFGGGMSAANAPVHSIAIQNDGRILIGGDFTTINDEPRNRIARLHTDGSTDNSFGTPDAGANARVNHLLLQPDEKILPGGKFSTVNGQSRHRLARLHTDGTLDDGFGTNLPEEGAEIHSLALQDDGKIVIGGNFTEVEGAPRNRIARLHANGMLESAFGSGLTGADGTIYAVALQDDGSIFIGGGFTTVNDADRDRVALLLGGPAPTDGYETWRGVLPPGEREAGDDPGGHGITNLLRYAFGMDALQPEREKLPQIGQIVVTEEGQPRTYLTLTYTRRTDDDSLLYITEASDDLTASWLPFVGAEHINDDGNGETATVTLTDSQPINGITKRFLRVSVER